MPNFKSAPEMELLFNQVRGNLNRAKAKKEQPQLLDYLSQKKELLQGILKMHYSGRGNKIKQDTFSRHWYKLEKFKNYHLKYDTVYFSDASLEALRRKCSLLESKEKLCSLYHAAKKMAYGEKLSRKRSDENFFSILKTELGYYAITPLILSNPSARSVVKIIIPIIEKAGRVMLLFSKPQALKIIYSTQCKGTEESLQLLYGAQVKVFDRVSSGIQECQAKRYIVMPILPGITVTQFYRNFINNIIKGERELGVSFVHIVEIMLAMAKDLWRIHQKGWVHSDIKSNNMLLTRSENSFKVAIIDDDDMKKIGDCRGRTKNFGAHFYHAPEISGTNSVKNASYASDVYALGITFVELLVSNMNEESIKQKFPSWSHPTRKEILVKYLHVWQSYYVNLPKTPALPQAEDQVTKLIKLIECMLDENPRIRISSNNVVIELASLSNSLKSMSVIIDRIKIPSIPAAENLVVTSSQAELDDEASDAAPLLPGHNAIAGSTKNRCCVIS